MTFKLAVRVSLNGVLLGLGFLVDFADAAKDCYAGNYLGAGLSLVFGSLDLRVLAFYTTVSCVRMIYPN